MKIKRLSLLTGTNKKKLFLGTTFLNKLSKFLLVILCAYTLTGCGYYYKERVRAEQWILAETSNYKKPYTWEQNLKMPYHSDDPRDYILGDGWGVAIPGKRAFDLYISPFAPDKYFRARQAPWSEVICPYTHHPLILGKRGVVAEMAIPSDQFD
jgi:hypothetical protein